MRAFTVGFMAAVFVIGVVYVATARAPRPATASQPTATSQPANVPKPFVVSMEGTSGTAFTLQCMVVQAGGGSASQSFASVVPAQYTMGEGSIVSCVGQKQQEPGVLTMRIVRGSNVLQTSQTAAAYGVVQAATQWSP